MREYEVLETYAKCASCRAEVRITTISGKERMSRHKDTRGLSKRNWHMAPICDGTKWHSVTHRKATYGAI